MRTIVTLLAAAATLAAGCSSSESTGSSSGASGSATSPDCTFVTEADLQAALGVATTRVPRDPSKGAGSTCNGNFAVVDTKTHMVLLIERLASRAQFDQPGDLMTTAYPVEERPTNLGAEAKLFLTADPDKGAKVLWLWKNNAGYEIVTFFKLSSDPTPQLTKAQLLTLGQTVAPRL
ncbi:MAG: hypothetical protein HOO96_20520 [Polyangiaceae bacterium]|nr:hypothetical protein [Polyangiaceae bacterium]